MKAGDKCSECEQGIVQDAISKELLLKLGVEYYACFSCGTIFFRPIKGPDVIKLDFVLKGDE